MIEYLLKKGRIISDDEMGRRCALSRPIGYRKAIESRKNKTDVELRVEREGLIDMCWM